MTDRHTHTHILKYWFKKAEHKLEHLLIKMFFFSIFGLTRDLEMQSPKIVIFLVGQEIYKRVNAYLIMTKLHSISEKVIPSSFSYIQVRSKANFSVQS